MTEIDVKRLRKVAEAATPGPWSACVRNSLMAVTTADGGLSVSTVGMPEHPGAIEDAGHIAAFDPPTVLALLDRLEAAEAAVRRTKRFLCDVQISTGQSPAVVDTNEVEDALNGEALA